MSESRVRLPVAGGEPPESSLRVADEAARAAMPARSIAVVGAGAEDAVAALLAASSRRGAQAIALGAYARARGEREVVREPSGRVLVRARGDGLADAITETIARETDAQTLIVGSGAAFVACMRARLSILVTNGASPVGWDPATRAVRDRFELIVPEVRDDVADALIARLLD